jgi:hypothetical protein
VTGQGRAEREPGSPGKPPSTGLGPAGWIAIAALAGLLIAAILYAIHTWGLLSGFDMPLAGWVFMILGVIVTFAVGAGLMALVFYSSRKGRDF